MEALVNGGKKQPGDPGRLFTDTPRAPLQEEETQNSGAVAAGRGPAMMTLKGQLAPDLRQDREWLWRLAPKAAS